jgi:hypothetical protein
MINRGHTVEAKDLAKDGKTETDGIGEPTELTGEVDAHINGS